MEIIKTAGTFDCHQDPMIIDEVSRSLDRHGFEGMDHMPKRPLLFIASTVKSLEQAELSRYILLAVGDLRSQEIIERAGNLITSGRQMLIDSGVYVCAMEHARTHGLSLNETLSLSPERVDGFGDLIERYYQVIGLYGETSWGYVELDQGGRDNKIKIRELLESHGLRPIPVYHPINDGWDYFDELASRYDRIAIGNIVQADVNLRSRIMATICERRLSYPNLWIHALGVHPVSVLFSLPFDSADASRWLQPIRWPVWNINGCMTSCSSLSRDYFYKRGEQDEEDERSLKSAVRLLGFDNCCHNIMWQNHRLRLQEILGLEPPFHYA